MSLHINFNINISLFISFYFIFCSFLRWNCKWNKTSNNYSLNGANDIPFKISFLRDLFTLTKTPMNNYLHLKFTVFLSNPYYRMVRRWQSLLKCMQEETRLIQIQTPHCAFVYPFPRSLGWRLLTVNSIFHIRSCCQVPF